MNKIQIDEAKGWEVLDALTLIDQADNDRDFLSGAECYAVDKAITVLREALAEQPAQRKPLTDEEIGNLLPDDDTPMSLGEAFVKFARAIEAKLKEKNT